MSFKELVIETEYRTLRQEVVKQFYIPLMEQSQLYQRAVGFFSSSALEQYSVGLKKLVDNGGHIQLLASPRLSEEDVMAIKKGYELRKDVIEKALLRELNEPDSYFSEERLNLLANYIALGKLDFRIAILESNSELGIYHEKLGLLYDFEENIVAFSGSANETNAGMNINYETIDVFCSWKDYENRVENKVNAFKSIWEGNEPGVITMDFPKVKDEIIKKYRKSATTIDLDEVELDNGKSENIKVTHEGVIIPDDVVLHDYQIEAIDKWQESGWHGIFDMATGTGKTYTALGAMARLCKVKKGHVAAIIVCPYQHLVEQWVEDLNKFGVEPIIGYSGAKYKDYKKRLENAVFDYNLGVKKFICFICTNDTFVKDSIQNNIRKIKENILLVVDEAHNFGADSRKKQLDFDYTYRLALSATIERNGDKEGTEALYNFFGEKCIEYTLERAIAEKKLTEYYYYPIPVFLTEDELEKYTEISRELIKFIKFDKHGKASMSETGKMLAIKRARIVAGAENKIDALGKCIDEYKEDNHMLVYCGTAKIKDEDSDNDEEIRQIDAISKTLGLNKGMKVAQYTSKQNMKERALLKKVFAEGEDLQALIAIKCLDEGVNIPAIKTAFILASTTNPKEYIQRRGRVLRLSEGKEYAKIYDFITLPRKLDTVLSHTEEETRFDISLVKNELKRIYEFKRLSLNEYDSHELIWNIKDVYDLSDDEDDIVSDFILFESE